MTTKTFQAKQGEISFRSKYYIIQGNNGNHTGNSREWKINGYGYDTKKEANKVFREMTKENGDIEFGLTPLRIVTPEELMDIYEGLEKISFYNCFDIDQNDL